MPFYREPTNIDVAYNQAASALEHASHAWEKLRQQGRVPPLQEAWPPSTDDTVMGSPEYHIAAMIWYIKQAHDVLGIEMEKMDKE